MDSVVKRMNQNKKERRVDMIINIDHSETQYIALLEFTRLRAHFTQLTSEIQNNDWTKLASIYFDIGGHLCADIVPLFHIPRMCVCVCVCFIVFIFLVIVLSKFYHWS